MNTKNSIKMTNEMLKFMNDYVRRYSQEIENIMCGYYDKFNPRKHIIHFKKPKLNSSWENIYQ